MLESLKSFRAATRLSANLFEDIEQECPGLLARLNGENETSLDLVRPSLPRLLQKQNLPELRFLKIHLRMLAKQENNSTKNLQTNHQPPNQSSTTTTRNHHKPNS